MSLKNLAMSLKKSIDLDIRKGRMVSSRSTVNIHSEKNTEHAKYIRE